MSITASSYKNISPEKVFSFQTIARNENRDLNTLHLLDWISSNEMVIVEGQITAKDSKTIYQEISFSLAGDLDNYFPLLRGILASSQVQSFVIEVNSKVKNFFLKYSRDEQAEVKDYLSKVLGIVKAEVRFKQVLRKVIVNQAKFHREERLLLTELVK